MLSQQLEDKSQHLETRVAALETELAQMRQMLSVFVQKKTPWWLKVAGSFENDPTFDEANRLGQEWRKSAEMSSKISIKSLKTNYDGNRDIKTTHRKTR